MSTLSYIFLLNGLISIFFAAWIYFDARARAHPQYLYLSWGAFLFGLIGFWLPYLSVYLTFRPVGKLVQCKQGHWKLSTLKKCPFCETPKFPSEESIEYLPKIIKNIKTSLEEIELKEDSNFFNFVRERLSHYQRAYITFFSYFLGLNLVLLILLVLILFLKSAPPLFLIIFAFIAFSLAFLSFSLFRIISLVEGRIVYYKALLNTFKSFQIEPLSLSEKGFYSRTSWSIQLISGVFTSLILLALLFLQFSGFKRGVFEGTSIIFLGLLFLALFLGLYLLISCEIKSEVDAQKGKEISNLLARLSDEKEAMKAKPKEKVSRRREKR